MYRQNIFNVHWAFDTDRVGPRTNMLIWQILDR